MRWQCSLGEAKRFVKCKSLFQPGIFSCYLVVVYLFYLLPGRFFFHLLQCYLVGFLPGIVTMLPGRPCIGSCFICWRAYIAGLLLCKSKCHAFYSVFLMTKFFQRHPKGIAFTLFDCLMGVTHLCIELTVVPLLVTLILALTPPLKPVCQHSL